MMWSASLLVIYSFVVATSAFTDTRSFDGTKNIIRKGPSHNKTVMCYEDNLSERFEERNGYSACTHIILEGSEYNKMPWDFDRDFTDFKLLSDIRRQYPHLNIMLGIRSNDDFLKVSINEKTRRTFNRQALGFILRYNFTGSNLYWESERSFNETEKENIVLLVKELRNLFHYNDLILTSTFGEIHEDNQTDQFLFEMSKHLDFMHISKKSKIIDLIDMGVPSTKITIQQQLDISVYNPYNSNIPMLQEYVSLCILFHFNQQSNLPYGRVCDVEKCELTGVINGGWIYFESSRHIANKMRFAMRHNLAGALVFYPSHDDYYGDCPIEHDTFLDFKTMEGISLNIPTCDTSFSRIHVVNNAITVSLDEMAQEVQLRKNNLNNVKT